jgi:pyridinium-3,5-bisthiocarboxylic acid mononucleotide nickel chelatase
MRVLYFDCLSGISGDMIVGALADLGVESAVFERAIAALQFDHCHIHFSREKRQNIEAMRFIVHEHDHATVHNSGNEHAHHHERTYADIRELISESKLSKFVKEHALAIFHRLASAEGKIHGISPDQVTFHEIGAIDSVADVVCACAGIEHLDAPCIYVSPLQDGHGWITCTHGRIPIPAPATLEVLKGMQIQQVDESFELITPTGAAIIAEFGEQVDVMPALRIEKVGYGAGERDLTNRPNVLRAVLGELQASTFYETDTVTLLETNIDDLTPEIIGGVTEKLLAAGALDVFTTAVQMKKNRPGVLISVLCVPNDAQKIADILFIETTTFGVRLQQLNRIKLERQLAKVMTPFGEVTVKLGLRDGRVIRVSPEFESCRELSQESGQPLLVIYEAAIRAFNDSQNPS